MPDAPTIEEILGDHKWLDCPDGSDDEVRAYYRRKLGKAPKRIVRWQAHTFAGPVPEIQIMPLALGPVPEEEA